MPKHPHMELAQQLVEGKQQINKLLEIIRPTHEDNTLNDEAQRELAFTAAMLVISYDHLRLAIRALIKYRAPAAAGDKEDTTHADV